MSNNKINKINYSQKKTLEQLNVGYSFKLESNVSVSCIKEGTFEEGDEIVIKDIVDGKHENKSILFKVMRNGKKSSKLEFSGGVFLEAFLKSIDPEIIILKEVEIKKEKIKDILKKD